jgi:outer membrane protein OmpA-like peptidoglycan-associated protein
MRRRRPVICALLLAPVMAAAQGGAASAGGVGKIPLCAGLTVVTAISQKEGDYESIKTITSVTGGKLQLRYSSEQPPEQVGGGFRLRKTKLFRTVHAADMLSATMYEQIFATNLPAEIPGTTAIGTSRAVLRALKTKGEAELSLFDLPPAMPGSTQLIPVEASKHPNVFDHAEVYHLRRVESSPVMVPVVVNEQRAQLPALHATGRGDYYGYKAEFYFLDDEDNPLALKWRLGIGAGEGARKGADRDSLQVVKIAWQCDAAAAGQSWLERALMETGHADIYTIHFSFNSDEIREESEPTLREIAGILGRHADWKLRVGGHTDAIGGDAANLELSKRRAAAVRNALVGRFGIKGERLLTDGYGKSRPVDSNDTEEGRARNRRVELSRQ